MNMVFHFCRFHINVHQILHQWKVSCSISKNIILINEDRAKLKINIGCFYVLTWLIIAGPVTYSTHTVVTISSLILNSTSRMERLLKILRCITMRYSKYSILQTAIKQLNRICYDKIVSAYCCYSYLRIFSYVCVHAGYQNKQL